MTRSKSWIRRRHASRAVQRVAARSQGSFFESFFPPEFAYYYQDKSRALQASQRNRQLQPRSERTNNDGCANRSTAAQPFSSKNKVPFPFGHKRKYSFAGVIRS